MDPHRLAEARSIAYHRLVADRMESDRSIREAARARVSAWADEGTVDSRYVDGWTRVLELPLPGLRQQLVADTEWMRDLRQVSPFAGVLSFRERWRLWRSVRAEFGTTA